MKKCDNGTCTKCKILESDPDVDQHTYRSDKYRYDRIHTHFVTYRCRNGLYFNALITHAIFFFYRSNYFFLLVFGKGRCANNQCLFAGYIRKFCFGYICRRFHNIGYFIFEVCARITGSIKSFTLVIRKGNRCGGTT